MTKLGFLGAGNMAAAMIGGIVAAGEIACENIFATDVDVDKLENLAAQHGIGVKNDNIELAKNCDVIFLCVKPNIYNKIIDEIKEFISAEKIIVSVAAGVTLGQLRAAFGEGTKIVRTMPNTPALVGCGMAAICPAENVPAADVQFVLRIFESFGEAALLPEGLFEAFIGVAGSSPAYGFIFIEALADAGVKYGLARADALKFAAQALKGAAEMVLTTGQHPAALKDAVCSPAGATIAAVVALEETGFRNAVISAASACIEKSIKMISE